MQKMTQGELRQMAAAGSFRAEPILNSDAAAEGSPLKVMGYTLRGPRGNRKVVELDDDGMVDFASVKLWLDGIAYANAKIEARR